MSKTEQFRLVMYPERKEQLAFLAQREGRSQASVIDRLILEKYKELTKSQPTRESRPDQSHRQMIAT
jgi:hypothetical protein